MIGAHRVAYYLGTGDDPGELFVCHHCDNKACCNPAHLYAGTPADNSRDMIERERLPLGEDRPFAKLTKDEVAQILAEWNGSDLPSQDELAECYGVSQAAIGLIIRGKRWKHVPRPSKMRSRRRNVRLTEAMVQQLITDWNAPDCPTFGELGRRYEVSQAVVGSIIHGKTWRHVPRPANMRKPVMGTLGSGSGNAKLTEAMVQQILADWNASDRPTQAELGQRYGVGQVSISLIIRGKSWRHVPRPANMRKPGPSPVLP